MVHLDLAICEVAKIAQEMTALRILGLMVLLAALIGIRVYWEQFFYSPLVDYFHFDFSKSLPPPKVEWLKYALVLVGRFALNSLLSLGIIWLIFQRQVFLKYSTVVFSLVLALLLPLYLYELRLEFEHGNLGFYLRRVIIQPITLIVLIPALFYLKFSE